MNSLRLVESSNGQTNGFIREKTKAQNKANEARDYFVSRLYQMAADFKEVSEGLDLPYRDFYCSLIDQEGNELNDPDNIFAGFIAYEPNVDRLGLERQPSSRIIFGNDGGVYYQPQEYDKSPPHQHKCYPIDELDIYELKELDFAYKYLETIKDITQDTIEQSKRKLGKIGEYAIELAT